MFKGVTHMTYNGTQRRRIEQGLCITCGKVPPRRDSLTCVECADIKARRQAERVAQRRNNRQCTACGQPLADSRVKCAACRERDKGYQSVRQGKHLSSGFCVQCGKNSPLPAFAQNPRYRLCEPCYLKKASRLRLGSRKHWKALQDRLIEQGYRCAYTGTPLILGKNDSLDHIYPAERFPEKRTDPTNIEWVTREVNEMKRDRTPDEFMALLQLILETRLGRSLQAQTYPVGESVA
jgi:5-methylcytosine-specific restriction endonuclease McrA